MVRDNSDMSTYELDYGDAGGDEHGEGLQEDGVSEECCSDQSAERFEQEAQSLGQVLYKLASMPMRTFNRFELMLVSDCLVTTNFGFSNLLMINSVRHDMLMEIYDRVTGRKGEEDGDS